MTTHDYRGERELLLSIADSSSRTASALEVVLEVAKSTADVVPAELFELMVPYANWQFQFPAHLLAPVTGHAALSLAKSPDELCLTWEVRGNQLWVRRYLRGPKAWGGVS